MGSRGSKSRCAQPVVSPWSLLFIRTQLEGSLKLREIAAGGHATVRLCSSTRTLWKKERETHEMCPERLDFSVPFPESFLHDEVSYVSLAVDHSLVYHSNINSPCHLLTPSNSVGYLGSLLTSRLDPSSTCVGTC